ncbi:hypothetical protein FGO68_gene15858 [Halteria grandinella]|uniref:Uncharacterized protein n=1 Tax=Halteria grandinella TaxID=5974 RepID=A0A8J8SZW5_HALGN|nr:hypothetical protein FGO68_gene15858 [Halteria grandinella]
MNVYYGFLFLTLGMYLFIRIFQKNKISIEIGAIKGGAKYAKKDDQFCYSANTNKEEDAASSTKDQSSSSPASGDEIASCILSKESNSFIHEVNQWLQIIFSGLVISSAFLCFTLEKDWFKSISANMKIPSYSMLGISLSFTFTYASVDLLQFLIYVFHQKFPFIHKVTLIITNLQQYLLLALSFILGALFGAIFGFIDVEDYSKNAFVLYSILRLEISICTPIGALFGLFGGLMVEYLRQEELKSRGNKDDMMDIKSRQFDTNDDEETVIISGMTKTVRERFGVIELMEDSDHEEGDDLDALLRL